MLQPLVKPRNHGLLQQVTTSQLNNPKKIKTRHSTPSQQTPTDRKNARRNCKPIWTKPIGVDCFDSWNIHWHFAFVLLSACCLRTSWTAQAKNPWRWLLLTTTWQVTNSTQWPGLRTAWYKSICSVFCNISSNNLVRLYRFATLPENHCFKFYNSHNFPCNPSCNSSSSRHASPHSIQQRPQHQKEAA